MSDYITSLPTDDENVNQEDYNLVDSIFKDDNSKVVERFLSDIRHVIVIGLVFFIFNLDVVSNFIKISIPYAKNSFLSLNIFKTIIFCLIVYVYLYYQSFLSSKQ